MTTGYSTAVTEDTTELSDGDLAAAPEEGVWRRQLIGLVLGIIAAAVVYFIFPSGAADVVLSLIHI